MSLGFCIPQSLYFYCKVIIFYNLLCFCRDHIYRISWNYNGYKQICSFFIVTDYDFRRHARNGSVSCHFLYSITRGCLNFMNCIYWFWYLLTQCSLSNFTLIPWLMLKFTSNHTVSCGFTYKHTSSCRFRLLLFLLLLLHKELEQFRVYQLLLLLPANHLQEFHWIPGKNLLNDSLYLIWDLLTSCCCLRFF